MNTMNTLDITRQLKQQQAERDAERRFQALGGQMLELAIAAMVAIDSVTIGRVLNMASRLQASAKQEGRDEYVYEKNYMADGRLRAIINATYHAASKHDSALQMMVRRQAVRNGISELEIQCTNSADVLDDVIKPILDAHTRYIVLRQAATRPTSDIWCLADMATTVNLAGFAAQCYSFICRQSFPVIDSIRMYSEALNISRLFGQVTKLMDNLPISNEDGTDIDFRIFTDTKDETAIMTDLSRVFLSREAIALILDNIMPEHKVREATSKSLVAEFADNTMSLNYYKMHYLAAYPLDKIRRRKRSA